MVFYHVIKECFSGTWSLDISIKTLTGKKLSKQKKN
jgi:hypothetical protein